MRLYDEMWQYTPGIYRHYDAPWLRNRQLAVKMTYLFSR